MVISWDSIRSLLLFFGPVLIPKALSYYRSVRNSSRLHNLPIQPLHPNIRVALGLLFFLAGSYLIKTLPLFAPEDLFSRTQSRLQIPVDVLFNRLASVRPNQDLTLRDFALRAKFVNLESRLLYLQLGPDVLADCPFCNGDDSRSYFYYALPAIIWPHVANLIVVTTVTSSTWTQSYGAQWRTLATIVAGVLCAMEVYMVSSYNYQLNSRALRIGDIDFFYWSMRNYRLIALAGLDGLLGWVIYLSATNRAFIQMPSAAERIDNITGALVGVKRKANAVGIVKNTVLRDESLYSTTRAYWYHEVRLMREVMEDREVVEGINDALSNRIDITGITRDAETYAKSVLEPLQRINDD